MTSRFKPSLPRLDLTHFAVRGLVALWPAYERAGTTLADLGPSRLHGTLTNGPTWVESQLGPAVRFDGTDDYVALGTQTALDLTGSLTIAGWMRRDAASVYSVVLARQSGATIQYQFSWEASAQGNQLRLILRHAGASVQFFGTAAHSQTGTWHHVAVTYDRQNVRFYFDGQADGVTAETRVIDSVSAPTYIGWEASTHYLNGRVAAVGLWNRALDASEIRSLYVEPWAMLRPGRRSWPAHYKPGLTTGTWSAASPADGATSVELLEAASIRFTPNDGASNPVAPATAAVTIDGAAGTATATAAGSYAYDLSTSFTFKLGQTHTLVWSIQTTNGTTSTFTQDFTVRDDWGDGLGLVDWTIAAATPHAGVVELGVAAATPHAPIVEWSVIENGLRTAHDARVEYSVLAAPDFLTTHEALLQFVCTIYGEYEWAVSADIGEPGQYTHPLTTDVSGEWSETLPWSLAVSSDNNSDPGPALSLDIAETGDATWAIAADIGEAGQYTHPLSVDIWGVYAWLLVLARLRSEQLANEEG